MLSPEGKKTFIEPHHPGLSISGQCELLSLSRSGFYYQPCRERAENLALMRMMDELHLEDPTKGARLLQQDLLEKGHLINLKRVRRLLPMMDLQAIYPKPNLSKEDKEDEKHPYLLRNMNIERINQVWASDITYVPRQKGFLYLVAIIDWYSRFILSWPLSNTLSVDFGLECLQEAFEKWGKPDIFNPDQGSQFTSKDWLNVLKNKQIRICMDGKGRPLDNIIIEPFGRTLKYRYIYLLAFEDGWQLEKGLQGFIQRYDYQNKQQSLAYLTPAQVYLENRTLPVKSTKVAGSKNNLVA